MTNGNEAAYGHGAENGHCCGLTKRELFAAMAMQGLLATGRYDHFLDISDAVRFTDALIEALNQEAK